MITLHTLPFPGIELSPFQKKCIANVAAKYPNTYEVRVLVKRTGIFVYVRSKIYSSEPWIPLDFDVDQYSTVPPNREPFNPTMVDEVVIVKT